MMGFMGFVLISTTGAKLKCTPSRLQCDPICWPVCRINSKSVIAPNVMFQGNAYVESSRMFKPHSASIPTNNGSLDTACSSLFKCAWRTGPPFE